MTREDYTEILVIVDRSGSMASIKEDMEGGLRSYIKEQQALDGRCSLSLAQFDDEYEMVMLGVDIKDVRDYRLEPRGMTALLDAVGKAVTEFGERLAGMAEEDRPGHVVVMIITDGQENSSREWRVEAIRDRIQEQTNVYGWTFLYLGANQDAISAGAGMGIKGTHSMTYNASAQGTQSVWGSAAAATTRSRAGSFEGYTQKEREEATR